MNGQAILENVRRYRAIASLHRQAAAFRPRQSWSLLEQASEWESRHAARSNSARSAIFSRLTRLSFTRSGRSSTRPKFAFIGWK